MFILNEILEKSMAAGASDIHLTINRPVTFRINGELIPQDTPKLTHDDLVALAYPMYKDNERLVQEMENHGDIDFAYSLRHDSRFRVNIFHQRGTMGIILRLLPYDIPYPRNLGVPESVVELTKLKRGLVLVTGATGSGKSTTLASLIGVINRTYNCHVITLEDPIEYLHYHDKAIVNQRELGSDTSSYAHALRAALRQDPDVILVGEMRDLETIAIALTAAETGHLVFSTIHTNNTYDAIDRIIDVFPADQQQQIRVQLANVLEAVISQQLLPLKDGSGRVAAFEVLLGNGAVRNLIREGKSYQSPSQIQTKKKMGMQMRDDCLYDLYMRDRITADDCIRASSDQAAMTRRIQII